MNNNQAIFMSVNTRHAGFSSVDLDSQNSGILVLFLAMMFLAPTPFVVVLKYSAKQQDQQRLERSMSVTPNSLDFRPSSLIFERSDLPQVEGIEERVEAELTRDSRDSDGTLSDDFVQAFDPDQFPDRGQYEPPIDKSGGGVEIEVEGDSMEDVELEAPDAGYSSRRMASRVLSMGLVENCVDGAVDTRLRLLKHYRGEKVPYKEVVSSRVSALKDSLRLLWEDSRRASLAQYMGYMWFIWFLILSIEKFRPEDENSSIFNTLFEVRRNDTRLDTSFTLNHSLIYTRLDIPYHLFLIHPSL